jgi:hypothetical protein
MGAGGGGRAKKKKKKKKNPRNLLAAFHREIFETESERERTLFSRIGTFTLRHAVCSGEREYNLVNTV